MLLFPLAERLEPATLGPIGREAAHRIPLP